MVQLLVLLGPITCSQGPAVSIARTNKLQAWSSCLYYKDQSDDKIGPAVNTKWIKKRQATQPDKTLLGMTEKQSRAGILLLFGLGGPITGRLAPAVSDERTNQGQAKSNS